MKVESVPGKSVVAAATATNAKTELTQDSIERLRTSKEVQQLLSISARALWSLYSSGRLPVVRLGRSVRFRASDIRDFIAAGGAA